MKLGKKRKKYKRENRKKGDVRTGAWVISGENYKETAPVLMAPWVDLAGSWEVRRNPSNPQHHIPSLID